MSHFFVIAALSVATVSAQQCYSPSDCALPARCTSLQDGIVPGTCVAPPALKVRLKGGEEESVPVDPPPAPTPPASKRSVPKAPPPRSSSSSSSSSLSAVPSSSATSDPWGFARPIIDPGDVATPLTVSTDPAVVGSNFLLAILTVAAFLLLSAPLAAALVVAPDGVKSLTRRLPISVAVFLVGAVVFRFLVPLAAAQGSLPLGVNPAALTMLYAVAFFLVAGLTNVVCNNVLTAEAATLERFLLPARAATGAWKRRRIAIVVSTIAFAIVAAHVASDFSLVPVQQPGAAILTLAVVVIAAYAKDAVRYVLARSRRWQPAFEASVVGIVLAALSVWLTRELHLSPGYVFGVPVGLAIGASLDREREGRFELFGLATMVVFALIAWSALAVVPAGSVFQNFLTFLTVILIEGAFFESLPYRYLAGGPVYRWNRWAWAALCACTTFLALHILWNTSSTVTTLGQSPPAVTYACILGIYVVAVVGLIAYCNRRRAATMHP